MISKGIEVNLCTIFVLIFQLTDVKVVLKLDINFR